MAAEIAAGFPVKKILCVVRGVTDCIFKCLLEGDKSYQSTDKLDIPMGKVKCVIRKVYKGVRNCFSGDDSLQNKEPIQVIPIPTGILVCIASTLIKAIIQCLIDQEADCSCHSSNDQTATATFDVESYVENKLQMKHGNKMYYTLQEIEELVIEAADDAIDESTKDTD